MVTSYLSLARKYTTKDVPLSKADEKLFASNKFESEWQKFVASKGFLGKEIGQLDFLKLSAEFSVYLAKKQTVAVCQARNRARSRFTDSVRLRA